MGAPSSSGVNLTATMGNSRTTTTGSGLLSMMPRIGLSMANSVGMMTKPSATSYRLSELPDSLDILEDLVLVGMGKISSPVNTSMPLRKRGLPSSFWDFCGAEKKTKSMTMPRPGVRMNKTSTLHQNSAAVFMPIREEGCSPRRQTKRMSTTIMRVSAPNSSPTRRRHSTTSAEKTPRRPRTPKKTRDAHGSRPKTSARKIKATTSPSRKRARSESTPVGASVPLGVNHERVKQPMDSPVADSFPPEELYTHNDYLFGYDDFSDMGRMDHRSTQERSMSCPVLDFGPLHDLTHSTAMCTDDVFMPATSRSSVDMSGTEVIGLLGSLEVSHGLGTTSEHVKMDSDWPEHHAPTYM